MSAVQDAFPNQEQQAGALLRESIARFLSDPNVDPRDLFTAFQNVTGEMLYATMEEFDEEFLYHLLERRFGAVTAINILSGAEIGP